MKNLLFTFLFLATALGQEVVTPPTIRVREIDGLPTAAVRTIEVSNGTLTIPSSGIARITTGGGGGSGDVTAAASFGTNNLVIISDGTGKGVKPSSMSIDASGNVTIIGTISSGTGGANAGTLDLFEGPAASVVANTVSLSSPVDVQATGLIILLPGTEFSGFPFYTLASHIMTPRASTTSDALTVGTIELGAAADTTLARSSAGNVSIEGNVIYRAGGTDVAVGDGGTGLSSGTSGGVLGYTASGTLASSAALAANAIVIGGGAGATPTTTTTGTGVLTALGITANSAGGFVTDNGTASLSAKTLVAPNISLNGSTGDAGQMLTPWIVSGSNSTVTTALRWRKTPMVEEFDASASGQWTFTALNSGSATVGGSADVGDFGTANLGTGALTNGGGICRMFNGAGYFGSTKLATTWRIRTPSALSSDADIYRIWVGFGDSTAANTEHTDGAYFEYCHSLSNGVWCAKTALGGARTYANGAASTVTVLASTWYTLRIEGDSTWAEFYVSSDDGATWTFIGSSGSNVPNTSSNLFGRHCMICKEAGTTGTTARTMQVGRSVLWP